MAPALAQVSLPLKGFGSRPSLVSRGGDQNAREERPGGQLGFSLALTSWPGRPSRTASSTSRNLPGSPSCPRLRDRLECLVGPVRQKRHAHAHVDRADISVQPRSLVFSHESHNAGLRQRQSRTAPPSTTSTVPVTKRLPIR